MRLPWGSRVVSRREFLKSIKRTLNAATTAVHHVGIDHRRRHILVPKQFLDGADVVSRLKQVRREAVPQYMGTDPLDHPRAARRLGSCALHVLVVPVMATDFTRAWIATARGGWKHVLPAPFAIGLRILARQRMGQIDRAESFGQIAVMKVPHLLKLCLQRHDERIR